MRNPLPSLSTLTSSFTRIPNDLESGSVSQARQMRRRTRSETRSHSHCCPSSHVHTQSPVHSSGATSYASAIRTQLPEVHHPESINMDNVNLREEEDVMYVEAPVSKSSTGKMKSKSTKSKRSKYVSDGSDIDHDKCCVDFGSHVHGIIGVDMDTQHGQEELSEERQVSMRALMEKYDPGSPEWAMQDHRAMIGQMLLDSILVAAGRLRKHGWVMGSSNEMFRRLCIHDRWNIIHEDLMRYTEAVKAYESWRTTSVCGLEFGPLSLAARCDSYGRTLAVIELASKSEDPEEKALAEDLSRSLMRSHSVSWRSHTFSRKVLECPVDPYMDKSTLGTRLALVTIACIACIVPMLVMVLDNTRTSQLVTTVVFTFAVGWILAYFMTEASSRSVVAMAAAYAGILVVFVGSSASD